MSTELLNVKLEPTILANSVVLLAGGIKMKLMMLLGYHLGYLIGLATD